MKLHKITLDSTFEFIWLKCALRHLYAVRCSGCQAELIVTNQFHIRLKDNRPAEDMEILEQALLPFVGNKEYIVVIVIQNKLGNFSVAGIISENQQITHAFKDSVLSIYST